MRERLKNMPVPVVATMLGAATLSNVYQSLGFDWVRHLSMWASTLVLLFYIAKIIIHPSAVKAEYSNTVPASLYAGITMVTMILCSYYKVWFPTACKWIFITAVCVHAVHILVFLCRNVFKGVNLDTFVPSWFVTFNGIMVSLVAGPDMLPSAMAKAVLYWGLFIYTVTIPFMVWRLITREVKPGMLHTQAIVLAPCSLCLVSYLNIVKEPVRAVVMILYVCVILSLLFILVKLPRFFLRAVCSGICGSHLPHGHRCGGLHQSWLLSGGNWKRGTCLWGEAGGRNTDLCDNSHYRHGVVWIYEDAGRKEGLTGRKAGLIL